MWSTFGRSARWAAKHLRDQGWGICSGAPPLHRLRSGIAPTTDTSFTGAAAVSESSARTRGSRSTGELVFWVVVVALAVRVAYTVGAWLVTRDPSLFIDPDTESYVGPARELLARGTFTVSGRPELQRTPGYPLLLVIGLSLGELVPVTIAIHKACSRCSPRYATWSWRIGRPASWHYCRCALRLHPEQDTWSPRRRFSYMSTEGARIVKENLHAACAITR